jgi:hypothetical protein
MFRLLAGGFALTLLVGVVSAREEKEVVSWEREVNDIALKLDFAKEKLSIAAFNGDNGVIAKCKVTIEDGVVKAEVTDVEEKGTFPAKPKVGLKFSFKWKVEGSTATLSDLKGDEVDDAKGVLEGEWKKKK